MIKFGVIGMGIRGRLFSDIILQNQYAKIEAVCDSNDIALKKAADSYNVKVFTDYKEMIDNCDLDAVIISTPDFSHKDAVIYAANNHLDIMVEKPFSTSINDCYIMKNAIKENGVKCLVAFENRWCLPFINVKSIIDNGNIGDIITINAKLNDTIMVPTKMLSWAGSSTPAWFLFPHIIDMVCWYNGKKAVKVFATGVKKKLIAMGLNTYDSIQAVVIFDDNTSATFTTSWIIPETMPIVADQKFEIIGDKHAIYIDTSNQMVIHVGDKYNYPRAINTPIGGKISNPPRYMLDYFIDCIRNNIINMSTVDDGVKNTIIIDAIHRSIESGEVISIEKEMDKLESI
jgi:predicted dehydrogenase